MSVCTMRLKALTAALIGLSVLCLAGCGSTRQASSSHSERLRVESLGFRDSSDVERVEVHDTITITRTITVQTNDKGDTLRVNTETDRERIRSKADVRRQKVKTEIVRDTVYIEKRDSVYVQTNTALTNDTKKKSGFLTYVKWIFALVCVITVLIITIKVCLRRI